MIFTGLVGLLTAFFAGSGVPPAPSEGVKVMTVEERITIRIPVAPRPRMRIRWEEEKGPKCLPAGAIAGAFLSGPDSIDFLLRGRRLVRARLDSDCDGLDFYGKLYGRTGIIYIQDYWKRHGETTPTGDHIDVWNGYRSSTKWLMEWFSWLGYYSNYVQAKEIWFWDVK